MNAVMVPACIDMILISSLFMPDDLFNAALNSYRISAVAENPAIEYA